MRSRQNELRLSVARQTISGRRESNLSVARFTTVCISRSGELSGVHVRMALRASRGFQFIFCVAPGGLMALGALHGRVLAFQRKSALLMLFASV